MQLHTGQDGTDLFMHQDIREGRKQAGGVGGHLKLGSPLTIVMPGSEPLTFEDLDDVIANFAEPYLENVRTLVSMLLVFKLHCFAYSASSRASSSCMTVDVHQAIVDSQRCARVTHVSASCSGPTPLVSMQLLSNLMLPSIITVTDEAVRGKAQSQQP